MSRSVEYDSIVIGAGPNGLVAANVLADAGWSVLVIEGAHEAGGAVRTAQVTAPGFDNDLFSSFYPLSAHSPVLDRLDLTSYGLEWTHAPTVVAHVQPGRAAAVLSRDLDTTMASMELGASGDGARYRTVFERWAAISEPFMESLLSPFPPLRPAARLARQTGVPGMRDLVRTALIPVRRFVEEEFRGDAAALLFAGNALHADLTPDMSGSGLFGWMLVGLGQQVGFPVPVGGAGSITSALVRRAVERGVEIRCGHSVTRVTVTAGRATGVVTDDQRHRSCRAVLADCDARKLLLGLVGEEHLPPRVRHDLGRFQRAASTFKVDWALSSSVPWCDPTVRGAGTVHIADSLEELTTTAAHLAMNLIPAEPFLIVGQMTTADPTRSPPGTESMWAYTHVPQRSVGDAGGSGLTGAWTSDEIARFTDRIEERIEQRAPGFRSRIVGRYVQGPADLEAHNPNLVGGEISGGTAQLHQQLVFRPIGGWARPETPIKNLYLASASAHPGGGVHGACGNNAARAALWHHLSLAPRRMQRGRRPGHTRRRSTT